MNDSPMVDILIAEDTRDIAEGLRVNLEAEGYSVAIVSDGADVLAEVRETNPGLLILDLMLPHVDGFHILRRLRDEGHQLPVLILSARASEAEKVRGFRIGADDYVTKPFGLAELMARIDVLYRRRARMMATEPSAIPTAFGDVVVRADARTVTRAGHEVALRPKEFDLLAALLRRAGRVISRRELLAEVWGYEADVQTRTVDTHIVELRRKLEPEPSEPQHILTVRKAGYTLRI